MAVSVRDLEESDIGKLVSIAESANLSFWPPAGFLTHFTDPSGYSKGVESNSGELIGFIAARLVPGNSVTPDAELLNIGVLPEFRGHGHGARLMDEFLNYCSSMNVARIWLEVRESNEHARAFYSRYGYQEIGRRPAFYSNPTEAAVIMRLERLNIA